MIDKLSIVTFDQSEIKKVWSNRLLIFLKKEEYLVKDEIKEGESSTYRNLVFKKYDNRLVISGSIHYFFNNGKHNANDFTSSNSIRTIEAIIREFNINPRLFKIQGIEYGCNISLDIDVNTLLRSLKFFKKTQITQSNNYKNFYFVGTDYFGFKLYNKTQDCRGYASPNVLRVEGKSRVSQYIGKMGLNTLADLTMPDAYKKLKQNLLEQWSKILLFDFTLSDFKEEHTTEYWLDAIHNKSRNTFNNRKRSYLKRLPKDSMYFRLTDQIKEKLIELEDCAKLTTFLNDDIVQNGTITNSNNTQSLNQTRKCLITGIPLDLESPDSTYIKTTTLKYLMNNDWQMFSNISNLLLQNSNCNHTKYEPNLISHLAKQIRNRVYNKRTIRNIGYKAKKYKNQYQIVFNSC